LKDDVNGEIKGEHFKDKTGIGVELPKSKINKKKEERM